MPIVVVVHDDSQEQIARSIITNVLMKDEEIIVVSTEAVQIRHDHLHVHVMHDSPETE